ncbi:MAG TPA: Ig-like domain-containing protein [Puia sp.]|nr:Ig-like domain-containing protein [Puia sp.]
MKRTIWIFWLLSFYGAGTLHAQNAKFNFTAAAHTVSGWANVAGDPATGVRSGTQNGITVSSIATANWSSNGGNSAYDGGGASSGTFFPAAVMVNHWFQYSSYLATYNALVPQLQLSGLNIDSVYTIQMTGSFTLGIPATYTLDPIRYTVAGVTSYGYADVNGNFNTADGAIFHNVAPDASGHIKIYVNTFGGSNVASICGVQVTIGHTGATGPIVALTHPTNNAVIPEDGNVTLSATASETGGTIAKVEFYRDTVKIGEDSTSPYSMIWSSPDPGTYTIKARAIDGFGNTASNTISIKVESLNYFWSTTGNIATGGDTSFIGTVDTNRLAFRTNNLERVSILKDGTVGIGTKDTKGYLLAVNGTAIFTKVKVKTAGTWPDYVFKKGYHLPDLKELQTYINQNQHLPGIVPDAEAQRGGIDVAAQEAALLKKIEELTLYLIRQNERLAQQQKEIDELKQQVKAKK